MSDHKNKQHSSFSGRRLVILQDLALSLAASLLSILIVRWLTDPIPGFSSRVWIWLGGALLGTLAGRMDTAWGEDPPRGRGVVPCKDMLPRAGISWSPWELRAHSCSASGSQDKCPAHRCHTPSPEELRSRVWGQPGHPE